MDRKILPTERQSVTHKFSIAGHEGYLTVGMYEDGVPGEIFITMAKEGSTLSGLLDCFAISVSLALQYGVPLEDLVNKFTHVRFEPSGMTGNKKIPFAKSIMDYIFRWLAYRFMPEDQQKAVGIVNITVGEAPKAERSIKDLEADCKAAYVYGTPKEAVAAQTELAAAVVKQTFVTQADAPACPDCGSIMNRNGSCYLCPSCGRTSGCS